MSKLMDDGLVARAGGLAMVHDRALIGLAGPPGVGKSTYTARLVRRIRGYRFRVAVVPMDGFHLPQSEMVERGVRGAMGRIDTFDAASYLDLLQRLRRGLGESITAPAFDRAIEEPVPDAITVGPDVRVVFTEGNYLLDAAPPWPEIRKTLHEVWYLETDEEARRRRLHARHVEFGKTEDEARSWIERVDDLNARRVIARRDEADIVVTIN